MERHSRRAFVGTVLSASAANSTLQQNEKKQVIHHVFFWLRNTDSKEDLAKLLDGLRTLEGLETIRKLHIGVPARTEKRDVVDASYSVSELMFFDDVAGQKIYQDHPTHRRFIETCGHLWAKVIVYDSTDI